MRSDRMCGLLLAASLVLVVTGLDSIQGSPGTGTTTATDRPVQFSTTIEAPLYYSGSGFVTQVLFILRDVTLPTCLDVCEGTKECDYVNYHLTDHHCTAIEDVTLSTCLDVCEGTKECDYVNYHLAGQLCTVIEHVDLSLPPPVRNTHGYVSGQKQQWTYADNVACDACIEYQSCTINTTTEAYACSRKGCGELQFPALNCAVSGNVNAVGSRVVLGCTAGYWPAPDPRPVSLCQSNGSWTPVNVSCHPYSTSLVCHYIVTYFQSTLLSDGTVITYRVFSDQMNYANAVDTCRNLGAGLIRISSTARYEFVNALMQCSAFSPWIYWIDAQWAGSWFETSTGEPLPSESAYWHNLPEPTLWNHGYCITVDGGYGMLNYNECFMPYWFICEL